MTSPISPTRWVLTLYVRGASPRSTQAIDTIRQVCDEELAGRSDLEIVDVAHQPALVVRDQILAVPTLVKRLPPPLRRLVGDLSEITRVRVGLDLESPKPELERSQSWAG
jgi:circadian clock protein KaiB